MTDDKYFKKLRSLSDELEQAATARPYDPDAYNDVVDQVNRLFTARGKLRRRRPWLMFAILFILAMFLGCMIVWILDAIII